MSLKSTNFLHLYCGTVWENHTPYSSGEVRTPADQRPAACILIHLKPNRQHASAMRLFYRLDELLTATCRDAAIRVQVVQSPKTDRFVSRACYDPRRGEVHTVDRVAVRAQ